MLDLLRYPWIFSYTLVRLCRDKVAPDGPTIAQKGFPNSSFEDKKTFDCDIRLGPALSQTPKNMDAIVEMIISQVYINLYVFGKPDSPLVIGTEFPRCHRPGPSMYKCTDYGRGTWARSISSSALWLVVFRRKCQPAFSR